MLTIEDNIIKNSLPEYQQRLNISVACPYEQPCKVSAVNNLEI